MATFACAVLLVALVTVTADLINNASISATSKLLVLENFDKNQDKSIGEIANKDAPLEESKSAGEPGAKNPYFKLLLENEASRSKFNHNIRNVNDFWKARNAIADWEVSILFGSDMPLNERELRANQIILAKKYQEYDREVFPPSIHFYQAKQLIEESDIFKIIRKLPKGANVYSLLVTSAGADFMYQLTFEDNLYFRFEDGLKLKFSKEKPGSGWRLLSYLRSTDKAEYIEDLNNAIKESLIFSPPAARATGGEQSTLKIPDLLALYNSLISYKPNFAKTFRRVLEVLYDDNIMYAELRYHFPELYDLDGKTYKPTQILQICKTILSDFKKTHKGFMGVRFIYEPYRDVPRTDYRKSTMALWEYNPDLIAGFGLVRLHGHREPLSDYVEELLKFPWGMKFFFHVGLTNRWGFDSDYNLLDALTLNSARIGEAFALNKHPVVLEQLRQRGIAVEFSPIAAQVWNFVDDLRNHPLALLVATNAPLVVGNSAGAFWNTTGLSYDWYEAYMAMTPRFCDLRCLKQFAVNSWLYSASSIAEKKRAILAWEVMWHKFIDYVIEGNYN